MFKRIKNIWNLSKYKANDLAKIQFRGEDGKLTKLFTLEIEEGDGKGAFFGEGTKEEFEEQEKKDKGLFGLFGSKK